MPRHALLAQDLEGKDVEAHVVVRRVRAVDPMNPPAAR
jgi:hypothetical protein